MVNTIQRYEVIQVVEVVNGDHIIWDLSRLTKPDGKLFNFCRQSIISSNGIMALGNAGASYAPIAATVSGIVLEDRYLDEFFPSEVLSEFTKK